MIGSIRKLTEIRLAGFQTVLFVKKQEGLAFPLPYLAGMGKKAEFFKRRI